MNPRVFTPDPNQIRDIRRINDGTVSPVSDNFNIVDHGRAKNVWKDDAEYKKSVGDTFKYTDKNYKEAFNEAARTGKPVVVVWAGKDVDYAQSAVEGPIRDAKNGGADAVYIFADRASIDPNSELGQYAAKNINENMTYTGIFALTADANGQPHLDEKLIANTWGARGEITSVIKDQLQYAQRRMDQRKGQFKVPDAPPDNPDTNPDTNPETNPESRPESEPRTPGEKALKEIDRQRQEIFDAILSARRGDLSPAGDRADVLKRSMNFDLDSQGSAEMTFDQRQALFDHAIKIADGIKPDDLKLAREEKQKHLDAEKLKAGGGDPDTLTKLNADMAWLDIMEKMPGITRFEKGMSSLKNSQFDQGVKDIKDAFARSPELATSESYLDRLAETPYDLQRLESEFPGVDLKAARQRLNDRLKDDPGASVGDNLPPADRGGRLDQNRPGEEPRVEPENQPQDKPQPESQPETRPETHPEDNPGANPETQPETQPEGGDKPPANSEQQVMERLGQANSQIMEALSQAGGAGYEQATALFQKAIGLADGVTTSDIATAMNRVQADLAAEKASATPNEERLKAIQTAAVNVQLLDKADGLTRIDYGMYLMGNNDPKTGKPDVLGGLDQIGEAAKKHPELFQREELIKNVVGRAQAAGVDNDTIKARINNPDVSAYLDKQAADNPTVKPPETDKPYVPEKTMFGPEELQAGQQEALKSGRTYFMKLGGSWCGACRQMDATTLQDRSVQQTIAENGVFGKMDVEYNQRHPHYDPSTIEFAQNHSVSSFPTTIAFSVSQKPDGSIELTEKGRFTGTDAAGFKRFVKQYR